MGSVMRLCWRRSRSPCSRRRQTFPSRRTRRRAAPLLKSRPGVVLGRGSSRTALPDYSMVMRDCGSNALALSASLISRSPRCARSVQT